MPPAPRPTEDRFWPKVDFGGWNDCWLWTGAKSGGYGSALHDGRCQPAHRVAYQLLVGPVPDETLDHTCRNKLCVNPLHLEPCSIGENVRRHYQHQTACRKGHPFDEENTGLRVRDDVVTRWCRRCHRERKRARRMKEKESC